MELNVQIEKWFENEYLGHNSITVDNLFKRYTNLKDYLIVKVHPHVDRLASNTESDFFINAHGLEHIERLLRITTELLKVMNITLLKEEVYLLLCSIQLHDIGNILGRKNHEANISSVISFEDLSNIIEDRIEYFTILDIAKAHGGKDENGKTKDTLGILENEIKLFHNLIRKRIIASILRFADEIADDSSRSFKLANFIKEKSLIYHDYSKSIHNVLIKEDSIHISYNLDEDKIKFKYKKINSDEDYFIIDEIYGRLYKMFLELKYFLRFSGKFINIGSIYVEIIFLKKSERSILDNLTFSIQEKGFPSTNKEGLYELCDTLFDNTSNQNSKKDSKYFINKLCELNHD